MVTDIRRALFIGLGGTGVKSLLHIKKTVYDNYGEIPPMLEFIGIDTDTGVYDKTLEARDGTLVGLDQSERLCISVANPMSIYKVGKSAGKYGWIAPGNDNALTALNRGAGQVRSNGRFAITVNDNNVRVRLQSKINELTNAQITDNPKYKLLDTDLEVHVIFSLSGGTGCGVFINLAYMLKTLSPRCIVSGYAVMGRVFRSMLSGVAVARVYSNSYGAIKDLDYLMSLTPSSPNVDIEWRDKTMGVNDRPFSALYLIDNKNKNSDTYMQVDDIAQMISLAAVTSVGQLGNGVSSVMDNVVKIVADGDMDIQNKRAWVSGLGVCEIIYDGKRLAQIYANKARIEIIKMMQGACGDASAAANSWIDINRIRENHGRDDVIDYFGAPSSSIPFGDIYDKKNPKAECDRYIGDLSQEKQEELDRKLDSLKDKVGRALKDLIYKHIQSQGGVTMCSGILDSLKSEFSECDKEMQDEIKELRWRQALFDSALEGSQKILEEYMRALFKSKHQKEVKTQAVCEDAIAAATCRREIKRREMAHLFYIWLSGEIDELTRQLGVLTANLEAVKSGSYTNIQALSRAIGKNSLFQYNLAADMVDGVRCEPDDIVFNDFATAMGSEGGLWLFALVDSGEVANRIWDYTSRLTGAQEYISKTVDDVLKGLDKDNLTSLCERAIKKSMPLLMTDDRGYQHKDQAAPFDNYFVGVNTDGGVLANNDFFKNLIPEPAANLSFVPVGLKDRVIIFHQTGVYPAFMVQAIDDFNLEYDRYEEERPGTSHWDYGLYRRFRTKRFDIWPANPVTQAEIDRCWTQALLFGIITKDDRDQFFIASRALGGIPIEKFKVKMGDTRYGAYTYFAENFTFIKGEIDVKVSDLTAKDRRLIDRLAAKAKQEVEQGVYHLPGHLSLAVIDFSDEDNKKYHPEEYHLLNRETALISALYD